MKNNQNTPKRYLQGFVEFYKLRLKVDERVLIPRPETELLVDRVIATLSLSKGKKSCTILDIGTGSGNIAIALAKNLPKVKIFATDISDEALMVAKENAKKHHVEKRIFFIKSNLLENVNGSPDIIVTNLPYIPSSRIPFLDRSVKDFEPWLALDGGPDGFDLYRKLFQQIVSLCLHLRGVKLIVGEIDYTHGDIAYQEAKQYFPDAKVEVKTDLSHKQRILTIQMATPPK